MRSNAEIVVDALERAGTRYVFGYPGGQNARFIEAMHGSKVEFVLVTHEACAGFMADVYGRLTGKPGACLSTLGPGATNMTTGVGNAFLDRVPLLDFPEDLADELSAEKPGDFSPSPRPLPPFDQEALKKAEALIRQAQYPIVAVGLTMNRAGATKELREFVAKHPPPV